MPDVCARRVRPLKSCGSDMAYDVNITEKALQDADAIVEWIKERSPNRAADWLSGLRDMIVSLDEFPKRCQMAPESHDLGRDIRQLLYGKRPHIYRILFEIREETVFILRIRHGAQAPLQAEDLEEGESDE